LNFQKAIYVKKEIPLFSEVIFVICAATKVVAEVLTGEIADMTTKKTEKCFVTINLKDKY
jgi:hypothetical protein